MPPLNVRKLGERLKRTAEKVLRRTSTIRTASGREIKVRQTLSAHHRAKKDGRARRRAEYLASLPKSRVKRFFYKLHPKRLAQYWFSRRGIIMFLKISGVSFLLLLLFTVGVFAYFRKDLPDIQSILNDSKGGSIRYYDRTGNTLLWEDFESFKRIPVKYDEISQTMKDATIAIEDKDFFTHGGFNLRGIIRAGINNFTGGSTQGGSTITQQLVKNTQDWSTDRSYARKIKELILSIELERSYTKQDILAGYLNIVPYGAFEVGVESASQSYFAKSSKDLTIEEAALLAAIPQSPQYYSPFSPDFDRELFISRKNYIIDLMHDQGKITREQRDSAKDVDILARVQPERKQKYDGIRAPYFVFAAKDSLNQLGDGTNFGSSFNKNGWKVITTLDLDKQSAAEEAINNGMARVRSQGGNNAAIVSQETKTGKVVALVGGADFNNEEFGKINFATTPRAPGSSVKPYDYAAMMAQSKNWGAGTVIYDVKTQLDGWGWPNGALTDYDKQYPGPMTVRYALAGSRNVPAVKAAYIAGLENVRELEKKMGVVSGLNCPSGECGLSAAIGDGAELRLNEHVNGFATFYRDGRYKPQTFVEKVLNDRDETIYEWKDSEGEQVLNPEIAYIVSDMISDPNASYMASKRYFNINGNRMHIKTGTTDKTDNGWLMGFSSHYATGVWVGRNDAKSMRGFMEDMTGPIWYNYMTKAHATAKPEDRKRPDGIKELSYEVGSSIKLPGRTNARMPSKNTDLFPSWYTPLTSNQNQRATIDTVTGKLATECTPERAKKDVVSGKIAVEIPPSDPAYSKWAAAVSSYYSGANVGTVIPTQKDDLHKCDDKKPDIYNLKVSGSGGSYTLSVEVEQGTHALKTVNFMVDGQILPGGSFEVSGSGKVSFTYSSDYDSEKEVVAEVIDSALYDAQTSTTATFSTASAFTLTVEKVSGNNYRFTCTNLGGAVDNYEFVYDGGTPISDSDCNYVHNSVSVGVHSVFARAKAGGSTFRESNQVQFTHTP